MQMEVLDKRMLRQDLQDGLPTENQSPNGAALFFISTFIPIL